MKMPFHANLRVSEPVTELSARSPRLRALRLLKIRRATTATRHAPDASRDGRTTAGL